MSEQLVPGTLQSPSLGSDNARAPNIIGWSEDSNGANPWTNVQHPILFVQIPHVIFGLEVRFVFRARKVEWARDTGTSIRECRAPSNVLSFYEGHGQKPCIYSA